MSGAEHEGAAAAALHQQALIEALLVFSLAGVVVKGDAEPRLRYRCTGEGYAPARTCQGSARFGDGGVRIGFVLPRRSVVEFVELRLVAQPGRYRIVGLWVDGLAVDEMASRVMQAGDAPAPSNEGSLRFASVTHAPTVELDLRGLPLRGDTSDSDSPVAFEVSLRREDAVAIGFEGVRIDLDAIGAALRAQGDAVFALRREQRLHSDAQAQRDALQESRHEARQESLQLQLGEQGRLVESASTELQSTLRMSLDDARRRETDAAEARATARSETEALEARLAAAIDGLAATLDRQQGDIAALRADVSRVASVVERGFWHRVRRRLGGTGRPQ